MIEAWHFVGDKLRDGRPVPPSGEPLIHDGPLQMCVSGLHASVRLIDALQLSPLATIRHVTRATLCRVMCEGVIEDHDKLVCSSRTILWRIDALPVLAAFCRQRALDVAHLEPSAWSYLAEENAIEVSGGRLSRVWCTMHAVASAWASQANVVDPDNAQAASMAAQNDRLTEMVMAAKGDTP